MNIDDMKNDVESATAETDEKNMNIVIQSLISSYLDKEKLPNINVILAKEGKIEEPGVLTETHIKLLQCLIKDYYSANNQKIEQIATERGIKLQEGILSELEKETLDTLIIDYCQTIKNIKESEAEQ